jgi:ADP-ribose pyrophosphatase
MSSETFRKPHVEVAVLEDRTVGDGGYLALRRLTLQNAYEDGTKSRAYEYDVVERGALDAVVVALHTDETPPRVCLRTATRPPLVLRRDARIPLPEALTAPVIWELPAGLVEADEQGDAGLRACAARETLEETGLAVDPARFSALGPSVFLSPGLIGERIHYLTATVDPEARGVPTEDGSPTEEHAKVIFVALPEAIRACEDGRIEDAKTEVALRRLAARTRP